MFHILTNISKVNGQPPFTFSTTIPVVEHYSRKSKVIMKGLNSNSNLKATKQSLEIPYRLLHKEYSKEFLHCSAQPHSCLASFQLIAVYCTRPGSSNMISLNWEWRERIGHYSNYPGERWYCR